MKRRVTPVSCGGFVSLRIEDDVRQTVVFIGYPTDAPGKGGIDCIGTAFLLRHQGFPYLITARHVAEHVGGKIRSYCGVNRLGGGADNLFIDNATWHYDPDPTVDVAVLPILGLLNENDYQFRFIDDEKESWWANKAWKPRCRHRRLFVTRSDSLGSIGPRAKFCPLFTLGQSHVLYLILGRDEEPIPIKDWRDPTGQKTIFFKSLLDRKSKSFRFERCTCIRFALAIITFPTILIESNPGVLPREMGNAVALWHIHLIGIWQGAWDAPRRTS